MVGETILVFLVTGITIIVEPFGPRAGPYDIVIEQIEHCKNQGSGKIVFGSRITNVGKGKYLYKENFTFGCPFDEHLREYVELQKWGNGGWRPKFLEHTLKNCDDIWRTLGDFFKNLMKSAGVNLEGCPVPAGSYKADWVLETHMEKTLPVMEYGKYRAIGQWFYKDELVGCIMVYVTFNPKAIG